MQVDIHGSRINSRPDISGGKEIERRQISKGDVCMNVSGELVPGERNSKKCQGLCTHQKIYASTCNRLVIYFKVANINLKVGKPRFQDLKLGSFCTMHSDFIRCNSHAEDFAVLIEKKPVVLQRKERLGNLSMVTKQTPPWRSYYINLRFCLEKKSFEDSS